MTLDSKALSILRKSSRADIAQYERISAYINRVQEHSEFFTGKRKTLPTFDSTEFDIGRELGRGEFSTVCEISYIVPPVPHAKAVPAADNQTNGGDHKMEEPGEGPLEGLVVAFDQKLRTSTISRCESDDDTNTLDDNGTISTMKTETEENTKKKLNDDKQFMSRECHRHGVARYAIKRIKPNLDPEMRQDSIIDLALESKFLSILDHPNIVKMRGLGYVPCHPSFFIILDRLYDTLGARIVEWRETAQHFSGFMNKRKKSVREEIKDLWGLRIMAALDIARALRYLHENQIVYRDLKPENIGFDVRGDAKVFDFGLSKELNQKDYVGDGLFNMSGLTGSRRYMAPEVVLCMPYNLKVDVFSFAILLWEVCALETPFNGYNAEKHSRKVVRQHERPKVSSNWPVTLTDIMKESWDPNIKRRPDFRRICSLLSHEAMNYTDDGALTDRSIRMMDSSISSRRNSMSRMNYE